MSYQITNKGRVVALCAADLTLPEYTRQITQMAQELAGKLDAVQAELTKAKNSLEFAQIDAERMTQMVDDRAFERKQADEANARAAALQAKLDAVMEAIPLPNDLIHAFHRSNYIEEDALLFASVWIRQQVRKALVTHNLSGKPNTPDSTLKATQ